MIEKLLKLLKIRFAGELMLKDGTPIIVDGDLGVGVKVSVNGPDGIIPLPAGSYELENGTIITVDDKGVVTDIVEQVEDTETPDQEVIPSGDEEVEVEVEETPPTTEEKPEEEPTEMSPMEEVMKKMDEILTKISELETKIATIEEKTSTMSQESMNFSNEIKEIKEKANFVKELPRNSLPDTSVVSNPKSALVERIKQLKNNK